MNSPCVKSRWSSILTVLRWGWKTKGGRQKYKTSGIYFSSSFLAEMMGLQNIWNSVLFSIICLPADFLIVNGITVLAIDFPFTVKTKVFEIRSRAVDLFGYISQGQSIPGVCAPDVVSNKIELSRNPRLRFFPRSFVQFIICMPYVLSSSPLCYIN